MSDTKISGLPAGAAANLTDTAIVPITDATNTTSKYTTAQLRTQIGSAFVNARAAPYLAQGNGVANDTAAIQAAITAVAAAGGGTVFLPAGTYFAPSLTMASNVSLIGVGRGATVLSAGSPAGLTNLTVVSVGSTVSTVTIANLTVQGYLDSVADAVWGIAVSGTDVQIDCDFVNCYRSVITRATAARVSVRNFRCRTTAGTALHGVYVQGSTDVTVHGGHAANVTNGYVWANNATRPKFVNCHVTGSTSYGIGGDPAGGATTGTDVQLVNCTSTGATSTLVGHGYSLDGCAGVQATNCHARGNASNGFMLGDNPISDAALANCTATANTQSGFYVSAAIAASLTNCRAIGNTLHGFCGSPATANSANRVRLVGCTATGNADYGVRLVAGANDWDVSGCTLESNTLGNVLDEGNRSHYHNNAGDLIDRASLTGIANLAVVALAKRTGLLTIHAMAAIGQSYSAVVKLSGTGNATVIVSDPDAKFSITAGTATKTNVYWSAGNSRYELENQTGGARDYVFMFEGH